MKKNYLPPLFYLLIFLFPFLNANAQFHIPQLKSTVAESVSSHSLQNEALREFTVYSPGLEGNILGDSPEREVTVYLPPGYSENPGQRYPVLYLFPRWNLWYDFWFGIASGGHYPSIKPRLDNLINKDTLNPFIVVVADVINKLGGSWSTNSELGGNWEDFIYKDLVSYVDENFRTIPDAKSRGLGGWSMGGYCALKLAMKHPDLFGLVYSMSGNPYDLEDLLSHVSVRQEIMEAMNLGISESFGTGSSSEKFWYSVALAFSPDTMATDYVRWPVTSTGSIVDSVMQEWLDHDLKNLAPTYQNNLENLKTIVLEYGNEDAFDVKDENINLSKVLEELNIEHEVRVHNGAHNYSIWHRMYSHFFPFFSNNLEQAIVKMEGEPCVDIADSVKSIFAIDGMLHVIPFDTEENATTIGAESLKSIPAEAFKQVAFPVEDLAPNKYKLVGISNEGCVSPAISFSVIEDSPEVLFRITDFSTGELLPNAVVTSDEEEFIADDNGELSVQGCGEHSFAIQLTGYYTEDTTMLVISDTTLAIALVKDSYLKVVDKATGEPVKNVSVRHGSDARNTDANGLVTVQNLKDGMVGYRTFISGYFTQQDTIPCNPGDTSVVEITRKKANVELLVTDEFGPFANQSLLFDGENYVTNEEGIALATNVSAREEHNYSLESECYTSVQDTFYVELDTTVQVLLQSKTTSPEFTVEHKGGDSLTITVSADGELYLVPSGTDTHPDSIAAKPVNQMSLTAGETVILHLSGLPVGDNYWLVYMINNCEGISKWESVIVNAGKIFTGDLKIYPNPAKDILFIDTPGLDICSVKLTNLAGRKLYHKIISGNQNQIDLSGLSAGIYILTFELDHYMVTQKIIKN